MGPAAMRRKRTAEVREPGELARRSTDVVREAGDGAPGQPMPRTRSAPPVPSRIERDRTATARASRQIPVPDAGDGLEDMRAAHLHTPPVPARRVATPQPAQPAPRVETPPPAQPAPAPRVETPPPAQPAPRVETPPPAQPAPRVESPPPAPAPRVETPPPPASRVETPPPAPAPRVETPPPADDSHPLASESGSEWPAPPRREPTPDPDDWSVEAHQSVRAHSTPLPAPPPEVIPPDESVPVSALSRQPAEADDWGAPPRRERSLEPPPTRISANVGEHGFKPPSVDPIPEVPEGGIWNAVRYAISFTRARWQRRSVIKELSEEIKDETASLDGILGTLGKEARASRIENRVLASENAAIDKAEQRRDKAEQSCSDLSSRQAEENAKFTDLESERQAKLTEAENALERAERELAGLEAQRRSLREKRKALERQQRGYLKAAEEREEQASRSAMGDARAGLRRAAEDLRRDAAALDPERQDLDRRLAALDKPMSQAAAKVEALKAEFDSARRSLNDAREGHRHRLAEIEAEQGRKGRELSQAEAEIQRRLVTLGTLVNLHRIEKPEFEDMYAHIDTLRAAIGARSTEIDKLTAEREAYDKGSLIRGFVALAGGIVALVTLIVILLAVF